MKTIEEIVDYCVSNRTSTATLRRTLPRMVGAFNEKSTGVKLHYAYHEDGPDTWRHGWSESDYYPEEFDDETDDIIKLVEFTWLIGKKKSAARFQQAPTYTAECAIFLFKIQPASVEYRVEERKAGWEKDFYRALEAAKERDEKIAEWNATPEAIKQRINELHAELGKIFGTYNSKTRRTEIETELSQYPSDPLSPSAVLYSMWMQKALEFDTPESYITFKTEELREEISQALKEKQEQL
jgi:hypothetical protein